MDGDFLYSSGQGCYRRQHDEIRMYEEGPATRFEVIRDGIKKDATLVWGEAVGNNGTRVCVTFQDGNIIEGIWNGETLSDGGRLIAKAGGIVVMVLGGIIMFQIFL